MAMPTMIRLRRPKMSPSLLEMGMASVLHRKKMVFISVYRFTSPRSAVM